METGSTARSGPFLRLGGPESFPKPPYEPRVFRDKCSGFMNESIPTKVVMAQLLEAAPSTFSPPYATGLANLPSTYSYSQRLSTILDTHHMLSSSISPCRSLCSTSSRRLFRTFCTFGGPFSGVLESIAVIIKLHGDIQTARKRGEKDDAHEEKRVKR